MTGNTVNGSRNGARSGAQTLVLLSAPIDVLLLQALAAGPQQQAELRRAAGSPAQTTLRAQLKRLQEVGGIERRRRNRFPGVLEYELTEAGRELFSVLDALGHWLAKSPEGPLVLGSSEAKAVIKALTDGWSTTMLRALAAGPLTLTELDRVIGSLSYPSLERRLGALRLASLLETRSSNGRGTPYAVTDWLRQGIAPIAAAARWELRHQPRVARPIGRLDVEAAFLLALPLLRPPAEFAGSCRLAAELPNGEGRRLAGVTVEIGNGVTTCVTNLESKSGAWAHGSASAWLEAVIEHDTQRLEIGGDCRLAWTLLDGLHTELFDSHSQTFDVALDVEQTIRHDGSN